MKKINIFILGLTVAMLASCSASAPLMVTDNSVGTKTGTASRTIWLGIAIGHTDVGIKTAAKNGGITKVATVDYKVQGGLFKTTYSTIVTGE